MGHATRGRLQGDDATESRRYFSEPPESPPIPSGVMPVHTGDSVPAARSSDAQPPIVRVQGSTS